MPDIPCRLRIRVCAYMLRRCGGGPANGNGKEEGKWWWLKSNDRPPKSINNSRIRYIIIILTCNNITVRLLLREQSIPPSMLTGPDPNIVGSLALAVLYSHCWSWHLCRFDCTAALNPNDGLIAVAFLFGSVAQWPAKIIWKWSKWGKLNEKRKSLSSATYSSKVH